MATISQYRGQPLTDTLSEALHERSTALLVLGSVITVLGVAALFSNVAATVTSVYFFGGLMLAAGITELVLTFFARRWTGVASHLIIGVLAAVAGVFIIRAPLMGAGTLTLLLSAWLLASGIGEVVYSLAYRTENWGWTLASGIASGVLGGLLLASWPSSSVWALGLYVGIALIFHGANWIAHGVAVRRGSTALRGPGPAT
jgi:uncharacterized membrane protein HdeD (DUF308 family)